MRDFKTFGLHRKTVFHLALFLILGGAVSGCAQVNRTANFAEALKKASENDMYIVLDISASW